MSGTLTVPPRSPDRRPTTEPLGSLGGERATTRTARTERDLVAPVDPVDAAATEEALERARPEPSQARSVDALRIRAALRRELFGEAGGVLLADRFRLLRRLGSGGMGVVFEAHDHKTHDRVALKTLKGIDPQCLYRLKREFRALVDVHHRNLVQLYELFAEGDDVFFTMELVDGVEFLEHLGSSRASDLAPVDPEWRALRVAFGQLAEGLVALHDAGKLHLDVKPSNVVVDRQGRVVLLDFGLVREQRQDPLITTLDAVPGGTPAYMAPEATVPASVSEACDWYSFGVILYQALASRLPFEGGILEVLQAKAAGRPVSPAAERSDLPPDLVELCLDLLDPSPRARPGAARILSCLGRERTARAPEVRSDLGSDLVGRELELRALREAFRAVAEGSPRTVHLRGRSGMGKTALARRFLDDLRHEAKAIVLAGRCYERESVSYRALDSVVDALTRHLLRLPKLQAVGLLPRDVHALARMFPVLSRVGAVAEAPLPPHLASEGLELRRRASNALRELLARCADRRPLVVYIDDLQWGDLDSIRLLEDLTQGSDAPCMLLILGYRSEDVDQSPVLERLLSPSELDPNLQVLELGPLREDEAAALATRLCGAGPEALRIARESQGSPLFVGWLSTRGELSPSHVGRVVLSEVILQRVECLPSLAREILETIATAGTPLSTDAVQRMARPPSDEDHALASDESGHDGTQALAVLSRGNLVRTRRAQGVTFVECFHDRIRETVVEAMAPTTRARVHLRIARVLQRDGASDPAALAHHLRDAGLLREAAEYAERAADRAHEAMAFDLAAELYRLAIDTETLDETKLAAIEARLGDALAFAGRGVAASRAYLRAAERTPEPHATELRRRAAENLLRIGHFEEGIDILRHVLGAVGLTLPETPERAVRRFVWDSVRLGFRGFRFRPRKERAVADLVLARVDACWAAGTGLAFVDQVTGASFDSLGLRYALEAGEPQRVVRSMCMYAGHRGWINERGRRLARRLLETARAIAARLEQPHAAGMCKLVASANGLGGGDWTSALRLSDEAAALFEQCKGTYWELSSSRLFAEMALFHLGSFRELARRLKLDIKDAEDRGDLLSAVTRRVSDLASVVHLMADDPERAEHEIASSLALWPTQAVHFQHWYAFMARSAIFLYRGAGTEGLDHLERWWPRLENSLIHRIQTCRVCSLARRGGLALEAAAERSGDEAKALLRTVSRSAARIRREGLVFGRAYAHALEAGVRVRTGDEERAVFHLERALLDFEATNMAVCAAAARRHKGLLLGGDEGRALVHKAEAYLRNEGVEDPARIANIFVPGFRELG